MKKIFAFLLAFAILLSAVACGVSPVQTDHSGDVATLHTSETNTEKPSVLSDVCAYYPVSDAFANADTRVLYVQSGRVQYYNKFTEDSYVFCFDPLCRHGDYDCISYQFEMADLGFQSIEFCEYDGRFYALRGAQLYSFSFDGSDLTHILSFGEDGDLSLESEQKAYLYGGVVYLNIYEQFVYFLAPDSEHGKRVLMRYDTQTKETVSLFGDAETNIYGYLVASDGIYISAVGTYSGLYRMSHNGDDLRLISEDIYEGFADGIYAGDAFYFVKSKTVYNEEKQKDQKIADKIVSLDVKTGLFKDVFDVKIEDDHTLLAVTDDYIYYTVREERLIGETKPLTTPHGTFPAQKEYNYRSRIYCYDKNTAETAVVLDDLRCDTDCIYFVNEKTVLIMGHVCKEYEGGYFRNMGGFTAIMDENGYFTELTELEM